MPALKHTVLALALLATPAQAVTPAAQETCSALGSLAESVMGARQAGVSLSAMLNTINPEDSIAEVMQHIIMTAFDTPRYHTPASQQRAIEDHRDLTERDCFRAFAEK